jgi:hypothetical protein
MGLRKLAKKIQFSTRSCSRGSALRLLSLNVKCLAVRATFVPHSVSISVSNKHFQSYLSPPPSILLTYQTAPYPRCPLSSNHSQTIPHPFLLPYFHPRTLGCSKCSLPSQQQPLAKFLPPLPLPYFHPRTIGRSKPWSPSQQQPLPICPFHAHADCTGESQS